MFLGPYKQCCKSNTLRAIRSSENMIASYFIQNRFIRSKRHSVRDVQRPKRNHAAVFKQAVALPAFIRARDFARKVKAPINDVLKHFIIRRNRRFCMDIMNTTLEFLNVKEIILPYELSQRVARDNFNMHVEFQDIEPKSPSPASMLKGLKKHQLILREPVIAVMGHVDHGKTTLLDALRQRPSIAETEREGITQKINMCEDEIAPGMKATFLDTPGHFHFFRMRNTAAKVADIVVLVVAADEGCLLQTDESIGCIEELNLPVIACINKIDKFAYVAGSSKTYDHSSANNVVSKITEQIRSFVAMQHCPVIPISAKFGENLDVFKAELAKMVFDAQCQSPMSMRAFLDSDGGIPPQGIVLESVSERGKGRTLKILIEHGRVRKSDHFVSGLLCGIIKSICNSDTKDIIHEAVPGSVVDIMYSRKSRHNDAPIEHSFFVLPLSKALDVIEQRELKLDFEEKLASSFPLSTDTNDVSDETEDQQSESAHLDDVAKCIILKADGAGSLATIRDNVDDLSVITVRTSIGHVSAQDIDVAINQQCPIYGFNIRLRRRERELARQRNVKIIVKSTIHDLIHDIKQFASS